MFEVDDQKNRFESRPQHRKHIFNFSGHKNRMYRARYVLVFFFRLIDYTIPRKWKFFTALGRLKATHNKFFCKLSF